ncbi:MAG: protein kinase [Deltaproteobacteria bacterium]
MQPGDIIVRRFRIERRIGSGGMGTVYRGRDLESGAPVAVKRLDIRGKHDQERFLREASVLADLDHPGIVRYVAHGLTEEKEHYLAMEWVDGVTLFERLAEGPLSVVGAVKLGARIADALSIAHRHGIVHRDIKPPNLLLPGGDLASVKLLDFGVARITGASTGPSMTRTGALIGTPGYMAPEQARGEKGLDHRADIFSLGSVLYEALTGRPPFSGTNVMAVLAKILLEEAVPIRDARPDVPHVLELLITRMLAKDPEQRPARIEEVLAELTAFDTKSLPAARIERDLSEAPTKPPSIGDTEQRVICVVLCGVAEGTADTWAPDTADAMEADLTRVVEDLGGRLDPLLDGSSVIHFSGQGAPHDLAAQAARCALALKRFYGDAPVVVATGRGVVSERLPFGEVIDRAARTLTFAEAGQIRVDIATAGLLEGRFDVEHDGAGPYLVGERDQVLIGRTFLGQPARCEGRQRELITIEATFVECVSEPVARALLITAPPGLGKTRLRVETVERLRSREDELEVFFATADSLGAASPFGLLRQVVRRAAGIREDDPDEEARTKLSARVARVVDASERDAVTAFLGEIADVPFPDDFSDRLAAARGDPMLMGDRIKAAWTEWLGAEVEAQPVLLVLDNLHWGDLPSVRLIDHALKIHDERPLMVIGCGRPELHQTFFELWSDRDVQELKLGPLTKKASEKLVKKALPDLDDERRAQIVDKAEGHPFLLEELMRAVVRGETELPDSVLGVVQAQLDALGPDYKRVLRGASVYGDRFWQGAVLHLLGGEATTSRVSTWLDDIEDRELIERERDSLFANERQYSFGSSIVREAAYAMLTDADRRLAHGLAAQWLAEHGERDAAILAQHFDRSGQAARAVPHYVRATEHALEGNDLDAVLARAQRGVECGAQDEDLGRLHLLAATAHYWRGASRETIASAIDATQHVGRGTVEWFNATGLVLSSLGRLGELDQIEPWIERVEAADAEPSAVSAQVSCLSRNAEHLMILGRSDLASRLFTRVESIVEGASLDALAEARWFRLRARRALLDGDVGTHATGLMDAAERFEAAGDIRNACNERMNTGFALSQLGEFERAEEALRRAREDAERADLGQIVAWADNNLAYVLSVHGDLDDARAVGERAAQTGVRQADPRLEGTSRTYLSGTLLRAGDYLGAMQEAERAAELLASIPASQVVALAAKTRALLALGQPLKALASAEQAMKRLAEVGAIEEGEGLVRLVFAEALHANGRGARAEDVIREARTLLFARAARITDLTWRSSFVDRVMEHRRTIELAEAWGLEDVPTLSG